MEEEGAADPVGFSPLGSAFLHALANATIANNTHTAIGTGKLRFISFSVPVPNRAHCGAAKYGKVVPLAASLILIVSSTPVNAPAARTE